MVFSIFRKLCIHHHYIILEFFHNPKKEIVLYLLYWFSGAASMRYHKLSDLSNINLLSKRSGVRNLKWFHWAKIKVLAGLRSFMESLGENPFPCLFHFYGCLLNS